MADDRFLFVNMCEHPVEPIRDDEWGVWAAWERKGLGGFGHLRGRGGEWGVRGASGSQKIVCRFCRVDRKLIAWSTRRLHAVSFM